MKIAGISSTPYGAWVEGVLKRMIDGFDGSLRNHMNLIHDRDPLFTKSMLDMLASAGAFSTRLPARSPNLNTYAEWIVRSIRNECLDRIIPIGR